MKLNTKQNKAAEYDVRFQDSLMWTGAANWDLRMTRLQSAMRDWKNGLGGNRTGRLVLHALCMVQHPDRVGWHWQGMVREFAH